MWVENTCVSIAGAVCFMQNRGILGAINFTKINKTLTDKHIQRERKSKPFKNKFS